MSTSAPAIPVRGSSWAAFNERRISHTRSKIDLRRKLSDATLEEGSERHTKLRIESIELDKEELAIENERLGLEKLENAIDQRAYQRARKNNNKRIISLGDDLWSEKRKLRKIHEQSGKIDLLTPDSDNAFAAALLRLYKDPSMSKKRQTTIQSSLRTDTIKAYGAAPSKDDLKYKGFLRCALTGEFHRAVRIRAAHIVPYALGEELAGYIFGPGQGLRLNRPENCFMMHMDIKKAFDNGNITLFPVNATARPVLRWKIILVNQDARNQLLEMKTVETVGDLDGREITFLTEQRPAFRFLYYHFVMSLLLCRTRANPGWETVWLQYGKTEPWPTLGRYLRESMLSALIRCVGIMDDSGFAELVNNHSFPSPTGLKKDEEDEIARRIVELFDGNGSQSHEGEEMEDEEDEEDDIIEEVEEDE
jgi:hypothetical protein